MDQDEGPGLGCRPQPLRHSLRRSTPINQPRHGTHIMNQPNEKPGYGNRGKTNCVFPPFPQPLLAIYTKYLTLLRPAAIRIEIATVEIAIAPIRVWIAPIRV